MRRSLLSLLAAIVPLAAGCSGSGDGPEVAVPPPVVTIEAGDYSFTGPGTVAPGLTTVQLRNTGQELHHVQLVRLQEGKTVTDLVEAMAGNHTTTPWAVQMGGPNVVAPGASGEVTVELVEGNYAMLCFIPSPDGETHMAKGMVGEFAVAGEANGATTMADPDVVMTLVDYGFELSTPLTAGRQHIRVENTAGQFHEVVLFLLEPGAVAADIPVWVEAGMNGPPPGRPVGGIVGIDAGVTNDIVIDVKPGTYALLCFLPDAEDGRPHLAHGMMDEITVM